MRIRIYFDNKRQYQRFRLISIFSIIAGFYILFSNNQEHCSQKIGALYCIFGLIWSIGWGQATLSLFEENENHYKRFRNVFILLTLLIVVMINFNVDNYLLEWLCYFNLLWGLGLIKKILSLFGK